MHTLMSFEHRDELADFPRACFGFPDVVNPEKNSVAVLPIQRDKKILRFGATTVVVFASVWLIIFLIPHITHPSLRACKVVVASVQRRG